MLDFIFLIIVQIAVAGNSQQYCENQYNEAADIDICMGKSDSASPTDKGHQGECEKTTNTAAEYDACIVRLTENVKKAKEEGKVERKPDPVDECNPQRALANCGKHVSLSTKVVANPDAEQSIKEAAIQRCRRFCNHESGEASGWFKSCNGSGQKEIDIMKMRINTCGYGTGGSLDANNDGVVDDKLASTELTPEQQEKIKNVDDGSAPLVSKSSVHQTSCETLDSKISYCKTTSFNSPPVTYFTDQSGYQYKSYDDAVRERQLTSFAPLNNDPIETSTLPPLAGSTSGGSTTGGTVSGGSTSRGTTSGGATSRGSTTGSSSGSTTGSRTPADTATNSDISGGNGTSRPVQQAGGAGTTTAGGSSGGASSGGAASSSGSSSGGAYANPFANSALAGGNSGGSSSGAASSSSQFKGLGKSDTTTDSDEFASGAGGDRFDMGSPTSRSYAASPRMSGSSEGTNRDAGFRAASAGGRSDYGGSAPVNDSRVRVSSNEELGSSTFQSGYHKASGRDQSLSTSKVKDTLAKMDKRKRKKIVDQCRGNMSCIADILGRKKVKTGLRAIASENTLPTGVWTGYTDILSHMKQVHDKMPMNHEGDIE